MLTALIGTRPADGTARFEHGTDDPVVTAGMAGEDLSGGGTDVDAVKVGADTFAELGNHIFIQAPVRARCAGLRAFKASLNAFGELSPVYGSVILGAGVRHGLYMFHWFVFPGFKRQGSMKWNGEPRLRPADGKLDHCKRRQARLLR